jgi:hypothetical protein
MHVPTKFGVKDERSDDPREIAFQCRLLDVISDLAQYVLPALDRSGVESIDPRTAVLEVGSNSPSKLRLRSPKRKAAVRRSGK